MQKNKQKILIFLIAVLLNAGVLEVYAQTTEPPPGQENSSRVILNLIITEDLLSSTVPPPTTGGGSSGGGGSSVITTPIKPPATIAPIQQQPVTQQSTEQKPLAPDFYQDKIAKQQIAITYRTKVKQARLYAAKIKKYENLSKKQRDKINDLYKILYKIENGNEIPESIYPKIDELEAKLRLFVEQNESMVKNNKSTIKQIKQHVQIIKKRADLKPAQKVKLLKLEKKLNILAKMQNVSVYDNENLNTLNQTFKLYAERKGEIKIDIYGSEPSQDQTKSLGILVDAIDEDSLELQPDAVEKLDLSIDISLHIISLNKIIDFAQNDFKNAIIAVDSTLKKRGSADKININSNILTTALLLASVFLLIIIIKQQNEY